MGRQHAWPIHIAAIELVNHHPTTGTTFTTNNSTDKGIITESMHPKISKSFGMRFYWILYLIKQKQFNLICRKGLLNKPNYFKNITHHGTTTKRIKNIFINNPMNIYPKTIHMQCNLLFQNARICYLTHTTHATKDYESSLGTYGHICYPICQK